MTPRLKTKTDVIIAEMTKMAILITGLYCFIDGSGCFFAFRETSIEKNSPGAQIFKTVSFVCFCVMFPAVFSVQTILAQEPETMQEFLDNFEDHGWIIHIVLQEMNQKMVIFRRKEAE